jgi:hypothetical protein
LISYGLPLPIGSGGKCHAAHPGKGWRNPTYQSYNAKFPYLQPAHIADEMVLVHCCGGIHGPIDYLESGSQNHFMARRNYVGDDWREHRATANDLTCMVRARNGLY